VADVMRLDVEALAEPPFEVVLSDLAPNTTGDRRSDQHKSEELCARALAVARAALAPGGRFVAKVFQGPALADLVRTIEAEFARSAAVRPRVTRRHSMEHYVVGLGKRRTRAGG
jgi:23S rRNA (uridine2552-2'-O)-methyltransferase